MPSTYGAASYGGYGAANHMYPANAYGGYAGYGTTMPTYGAMPTYGGYGGYSGASYGNPLLDHLPMGAMGMATTDSAPAKGKAPAKAAAKGKTRSVTVKKTKSGCC